MPNKNENLRRRKLIQQDNSEKSAESRSIKKKIQDKNLKGSPNSGLFFSFLCLVATVTIFIVFFSVYTDSIHPLVDTIASQLGYSEKQYGAIIDAGSTGSRVLAFEFHKGYLDGRLVLDNELFKELKPGLSSLTPEKGADQINQLLNEARNFIPQEYWISTPLALKAPAGLRLLGASKSEEILNVIRELFSKSGFSVNEHSVEIMDGTDEGIFSWFTVNYLSNRLTSKNTVAALDLGGGSTQVTYEMNEFQPSYKNFIHAVPILNNNEVNVFTNSYLGLGLMALRHAVITKKGAANQTSFESECVNPIIKEKSFNYGNVDYLVSGKENKRNVENPEVDYELCTEAVKRQVISLLQPKPIKLGEHIINAFSYYYDRAIETGLVDPFQGGEITVFEFTKKSREICATPNTDQPFMCLDLIYISVLLQDGFGLKPQTNIKLFKKIRGHEVSWALGCFFQNYNDLVKRKKKAE
ncbi:CLUMA_CG014384, isoform A [Clunio marinus]|uniref:CLUMA_CG014384, isoform A n=1 Tax=Clunio marinus TaxID=568069 RepID=A0A1J1IN73_9DIPT|nr:CLUMA_CG014384, isoform A [Clunio marinus]